MTFMGHTVVENQACYGIYKDCSFSGKQGVEGVLGVMEIHTNIYEAD